MKALLFFLCMSSLPAMAAKITEAKCSDLTSVTPEYLAVVDGYDKAGRLVSREVDMGGLVSEAQKVNENCAKDRSASISKVRKDLKNFGEPAASASVLNPLKAKCSDFLALGEEVQPVAVYWVAGHDKAGKLKTGVVDEQFLARPVATLIEDCRSKPTASFYEKTKAWLKKHL